MSGKIIIDTETTGLTPGIDEIIELAAIDAETGDVLINQRYGTKWTRDWYAAERINGISPAEVAGLPPLDAQSDAAAIIRDADLIIGWNVHFDLDMLQKSSGIETKAESYDVMKADARLLGEITPDRRSGKYRKLSDAATWWGYEEQDYHTALIDCQATRHVYRRLLMVLGAEWNRDTKSKIVMCRNYLRSIQSDMHMIHAALMVASLQTDKDIETQGMLDMLISDLRTIAGDTAVAAGGLGGADDG